MSPSLEDRLTRLEDLLAIHQLFIDYGHYLDAGDFESYASLFADDAELMLGPVARATGPAQIRAAMESGLAGQVGASYHVISGPRVDLQGDTATGEVMWTVVHRDADGTPKLTMTGRHKDDLVKVGSAWKFKRRRGFVDIPGIYRAPVE